VYLYEAVGAHRPSPPRASRRPSSWRCWARGTRMRAARAVPSGATRWAVLSVPVRDRLL